MVGAPPPLHPCPPRAPPTCPILHNIAPHAVLDPEIAARAVSATRPRFVFALLTLALPCSVFAQVQVGDGDGGTPRTGSCAARVCRQFCGRLSAAVFAGWGGLKARARARHGRDWRRRSARCLLPTPFPSAPTRCLGHHHFPVLLFLLPRVRRYAVVPISDATRLS